MRRPESGQPPTQYRKPHAHDAAGRLQARERIEKVRTMQSRGVSLIEAMISLAIGHALAVVAADHRVPMVRIAPKPWPKPAAGRDLHRDLPDRGATPCAGCSRPSARVEVKQLCITLRTVACALLCWVENALRMVYPDGRAATECAARKTETGCQSLCDRAL